MTLALVGFAFACGGSTTNYYRKATAKQKSCCEKLGDEATRAACLNELPQVENPADETSAENQHTFYCVDEHWVCDPETGHETQASAQEQLDCINQQ